MFAAWSDGRARSHAIATPATATTYTATFLRRHPGSGGARQSVSARPGRAVGGPAGAAPRVRAPARTTWAAARRRGIPVRVRGVLRARGADGRPGREVPARLAQPAGGAERDAADPRAPAPRRVRAPWGRARLEVSAVTPAAAGSPPVRRIVLPRGPRAGPCSVESPDAQVRRIRPGDRRGHLLGPRQRRVRGLRTRGRGGPHGGRVAAARPGAAALHAPRPATAAAAGVHRRSGAAPAPAAVRLDPGAPATEAPAPRGRLRRAVRDSSSSSPPLLIGGFVIFNAVDGATESVRDGLESTIKAIPATPEAAAVPPKGVSGRSLVRRDHFAAALAKLSGSELRLTHLRVAPERIDAQLLTRAGALRSVQVQAGRRESSSSAPTPGRASTARARSRSRDSTPAPRSASPARARPSSTSRSRPCSTSSRRCSAARSRGRRTSSARATCSATPAAAGSAATLRTTPASRRGGHGGRARRARRPPRGEREVRRPALHGLAREEGRGPRLATHATSRSVRRQAARPRASICSRVK